MPSTSFLGRRRELGEIVNLIVRDDVRLLTLTGPGGSGKTRLAAEAAAELADRYRDGVWWVPLTPLRDARLVTAAATQTLGVSGELASAIADRSLLLVFDNFEQVVEAAAEVAGLLPACPRLELLVTSREPLHVAGEQQYPVPPLLPNESVELFIARARAVQPDLEVNGAVPEICRRLDDLPLAVELAAARTAALSPGQILERLDQRLPLLTGGPRDAPARQRTLRDAITWSHGLLTDAERLLFARLSVFSGGCTLEAAEQVTEANLDTLQSLVDKNLLRHARERYSMLETIREYASERLQQSGEAGEFGRRHADHFLTLAEQAAPNLSGSEISAEWLDRLDREHDNLRAALDRVQTTGNSQLALRLAGALSHFWYLRGHVAEGAHRLASALRASEGSTTARAKALRGAAVMAIAGGDLATGRLYAEEALAVYRQLGDAWGIAHAGFLLGHAAADEKAFPDAERHFAESAQRFRELGDEHYTLLVTVNLAEVVALQGDLARARTLHEQNLADARLLSDQRVVALSLLHLASYSRTEGRTENAISMLAEALRIFHSLGLRTEIVDALSRFASALAPKGSAKTTAKLLACSETLRDQIGSTSLPLVANRNLETLTAIRRQLDKAALADAWDQGQALTIDQAVAIALESSDEIQRLA